MYAHVCVVALLMARATVALAQASVFESGPYVANLSAR